ncbi:MAG TPA: hypothetical protein PK176_12535 [Acidobacteriota bacterium]|nr:hypothetical protein [Acidobacteriota bacterium]HQM64132.1 hypothetical protein [Acidobacteriota bacterium]
MKAKLTSVVVGLLLVVLFSGAAGAQSSLTVEPITWDVIGLDSNSPTAGPKYFPVGVRITNTGASTSGVLTATFVWDSSNSYINLRPNTLSTLDLGTLAGNGGWVDAYFEVEVTQDTAAYEASRSYHISVAEGGTWNANSPIRALYVEHLVSQGRNDVTNMYLSVTEPPTEGPYGTEIPNGGSMTLMVGNTYWITLEAYTATNGYEQLESFINFPNIIFQILDVTTTYTADSSTNVENPSDKLYGDGCVWDSDPTSPNYLSCLSTGKVGGDLITIYEVKILQIPDAPRTNPEPLTTLIYDFSGSSFHYNSDFGGETRYATIISAGIEKSFAPKSINPDTVPAGTSTLTFTITNPGTTTITDVSFYDDLPTNGGTGRMRLASTTFTYGGSFSVNPTPDPLMTVGGTWLSFTGAEIPGLSSATIAVTVTVDEAGTYHNVSDNLFIDSTIDTGDWAEDTLVATNKPPGPSTCDPRSVLATWTMPTGSTTSPPPYTTIAADVAEATANYLGGTTVRISTAEGNPVNSWEILGGWELIGTLPNANASPYFQFQVDTSNYGGAAISFDIKIDPPGAWQSAGADNIIYVYSSADGSTWNNIGSFEGSKGKWVSSGTLPALPLDGGTGVVYTYFRINAKGAATSAATVLIDNVTVYGCPRPDPPTLAKTFSDVSICQGDYSELTFTFTNPNATSLTNVEFTDVLPVGLEINNPNGTPTVSCTTGSSTGHTITAVAGTRTISMTGATLAANSSCSFTVYVKGAAAGSYVNTSGSISSLYTGPNNTDTGYGTDNLIVIATPVINKTFGTTNLITGETTSLTFTITNPNGATELTGVGFTDTLPSGLDVTSDTVTLPCNASGTLTLTDNNPNPDTIVLSGATLAGGGSCTFSVDVTGTTAGTYENTVQVTSAGGCTGNTASATVIVRDLISSLAFQKQISTSSSGPWYDYMTVAVGTPLYYRFLVENTGETALTNVTVSDPSLDPFSCTWPSPLPVAVAGNDNHIAYCVPTKTVTAALGGPYTNTATVTADYPTSPPQLTATDIARYEGQNPTAVVIGRVALGYARVTDFLRSIGVPEIGIAELQNILRVWAPDSPAGESTDRQELLDALMAYLDPDGDGRVVVFRWETLEERGAIGFYADRLTDGTWVRINAGMLPGLIASPMGAEYWLADPGASPGNDYVYRLIEVEARGTTREYGPFDLRVEIPLP